MKFRANFFALLVTAGVWAHAQTDGHLGVVSVDAAIRAMNHDGATYSAAADLLKERVFVYVDDLDQESFRTGLAQSLRAEWKNNKLVRTAAQRKSEEDAEFKSQRDRLKAAMQRNLEKSFSAEMTEAEMQAYAGLKQKINDRATTDQDRQAAFRQMMKLERSGPSGRFFTAFAAQVDPSLFLARKPGQRMVFRANPTSSQIALPPAIVREAERWIDSIKRIDAMIPKSEEQNSFMMRSGNDVATEIFDTSGQIAGITLIAQWGGKRAIEFTLVGVDTKGNRMARASLSMNLEGRDEPRPEIHEIESTDALIFSETAKEAAKLSQSFLNSARQRYRVVVVNNDDFSSLGSGDIKDGPANQLSRELVKKLLDPVTNDPLELFVGEGLRQVAAAEHKPIIMQIPDQAMLGLAALTTGTTNAKQFFASLQREGGVVATESNGMLIGSPREPIAARDTFTNREALGAFIRAYAARGYTTLDERADFVASLPLEAERPSIWRGYLAALNNSELDGLEMDEFSGAWMALRVYGSLTASQRTSARQTGLQIGSLSPAQQSVLSDIVFNRRNDPFDIEDPKSRFRFGDRQDSERTDRLPNGLPRMGVIKVDVEEKAGLQVRDSVGNTRIMSLRQVALNKLAVDGKLNENFGHGVAYAGYRPIALDSYTLKLGLLPNYGLAGQMSDVRFSKEAPFVAWDQLSPDLTKQVMSFYDREGQALGGATIRFGEEPDSQKP